MLHSAAFSFYNIGMEYVVVPKSLYAAVDVIDKYWQQHGNKEGTIEGKGDWAVVKYCYDLFCIAYPEDLKIFTATQKRVRANLKHKYGNVEKVGSSVEGQHMMNMPQKLYQLIATFYPQQKWTKEFVIEFCNKMPTFRVPDKI